MGGGSNNSQREAEAAERERQARIAQSTGAINAIYDSPERQAQYDRLASDTTTFYRSDLDRQKEVNDRKLKFALARGGQIGGSVQVDQSTRLGEDYLKGVVEASRRGQAAGANLRGMDEQARLNLIAMAQTGLDATTASARAANSLRSNLEAGKAESTASSLGDMFGSFGDIYQRSQQQAEYKRGLRDYSPGSAYYKPLYGAGG